MTSLFQSKRPVTIVGGGDVGPEDLNYALSIAPTRVAADGGSIVALAAGIEQSVVDALAADIDPDFSNDDEQLIYEFSRELNLKRGVSDALYARAITMLGEEGTVDLVGVLGYYALISMTIKAFDVDPITAS